MHLPKFVLLTCNFQNSFHELFQTLCLCLCICIYEFYSIKPSDFTETKIYVKLDPRAPSTAHSSKVWDHHLLTMELSIVRN